MFLATSNKVLRLLCLTYCDQVSLKELERHKENVITQMVELGAGFRVLADLSRMEGMDLDCLPLIGEIMERLEQNGVGLIVRVMTDPKQDIGFGILSAFHYRNSPHVVSCASVCEAMKALGL